MNLNIGSHIFKNMKKWIYKGFIGSCLVLGLLFSTFSYANILSRNNYSKKMNMSAPNCGPTRPCRGIGSMSVTCFPGCSGLGNCSPFYTGKRCCLTYIVHCPIEGIYSTIKICNDSGICDTDI